MKLKKYYLFQGWLYAGLMAAIIIAFIVKRRFDTFGVVFGLAAVAYLGYRSYRGFKGAREAEEE
jgi:hypothetical protein